MRFALMTEPQQGLSYDEILALARTAEHAGLEACLRSDHYTSFPGQAGMPTTDAWPPLAHVRCRPPHTPEPGWRWGAAPVAVGSHVRRRVQPPVGVAGAGPRGLRQRAPRV